MFFVSELLIIKLINSDHNSRAKSLRTRLVYRQSVARQSIDKTDSKANLYPYKRVHKGYITPKRGLLPAPPHPQSL